MGYDAVPQQHHEKREKAMKLPDKLEALYRANLPALLIGLPGTGKTAAAHALAAKTQSHIEVVIGSGLSPEDVGGVPAVSRGDVRWTPPSWARALMEHHGTSILLLDELTCTPPAVQAPLMRLIQERRCADWKLPPECRVFAAANPPEIAAGGWDIAAPLANRVAHLRWEVDHQAWQDWMIAQPDYPEARGRICAFLHRSPALLLQFPKADKQGGPWPSPRTWDYASRVEECPELVGSLVGDGPASEYVTWRRALDLPDPEDILTGRASLPERMDARFACILGVVSLAVRTQRDSLAWGIIHQESQRALDIAVPAARALMAAHPGQIPDEVGALFPALKRVTS